MTLTEMRTAVLQRLHALDVGSSPSPEDGDLVGDKYTALHAMLLSRNLVTWAVTEDIPAKVQDPVVAMVAALCINEFAVQEPRRSQLLSEGALDLPMASLAERQLRKSLASTYVSTPQRATYY